MKCTNCKYYQIECKNPEVSFNFLDQHDWGVQAANDCDYYETAKVMVELKNIEYGLPNTKAVITINVGSVEFRVPVFNSKFDNGLYCMFPGENRSKNGFKYYNISVITGLTAEQNKSIILTIKAIIIDIFLYFEFEKDDEIFDNRENEIIFEDFIFSAKAYFKQLEEQCPF